MRLSKPAPDTEGLWTTTRADRQVIADAINAGARYLVTTDMDEFAVEDLDAHAMSAVNPDYFMALSISERAYGVGVRTLAEVARNPPRTEPDVHRMLGRRHPNVSSRFADAYETAPVPPDPDQPDVRFRGAICVRCEEGTTGAQSRRRGLCTDHL